MSSTVVLVAGGGADWEARAMDALGARAGVVVLKRCVDVDDLLAAASSGQAEAALVDLAAHGLDATAVDLLRRHGVRPIGVVAAGTTGEQAHARASRVGIRTLVAEADIAEVAEVVLAPERPAVGGTVARDDLPQDPAAAQAPAAGAPREPGRVLAVWGPAGAPGRTTVATALAATSAARGRATLLVDVDPWGGAVAQQLGVLDEVSGLLAAARLATSGVLEERFATVLRSLGGRLEILTGLPRADRWPELRDGVVEEVLDLARQRGRVVVDTGAPLERDPTTDLSGRPGRNAATLAALAEADDLLVVGTADPVGLARLARGLVELGEETGGRPVHVAVNRMRPSLGWSTGEVEQMVRGFGDVASVTFLPEDQAATDRALVAGRSVVELGEGPLAGAVDGLADTLWGPVPGSGRPARQSRQPRQPRRSGPAGGRTRVGTPALRRRTAGTTRRR